MATALVSYDHYLSVCKLGHAIMHSVADDYAAALATVFTTISDPIRALTALFP